MGDFFILVRDFYVNLFSLLNNTVFDINGYNVSLGAIIFVMLVVSMVVSVFWKGARA